MTQNICVILVIIGFVVMFTNASKTKVFNLQVQTVQFRKLRDTKKVANYDPNEGILPNFNMMTFYYIRHGESTWNELVDSIKSRKMFFSVYKVMKEIGKKEKSNYKDAPLTPNGVQDAKNIQNFLQDYDPMLLPEHNIMLASSPLRRSLETLRIARDYKPEFQKKEIYVHPGLAEGCKNPDCISNIYLAKSEYELHQAQNATDKFTLRNICNKMEMGDNCAKYSNKLVWQPPKLGLFTDHKQFFKGSKKAIANRYVHLFQDIFDRAKHENKSIVFIGAHSLIIRDAWAKCLEDTQFSTKLASIDVYSAKMWSLLRKKKLQNGAILKFTVQTKNEGKDFQFSAPKIIYKCVENAETLKNEDKWKLCLSHK